MLKHITSLSVYGLRKTSVLARASNWRASVASVTLTGVKMKKSGMFVYLYICLDVRMSFCTLTLAFLC